MIYPDTEQEALADAMLDGKRYCFKCVYFNDLGGLKGLCVIEDSKQSALFTGCNDFKRRKNETSSHST